MSWFELKRIAERVTAMMEPGHFEEVISYLVVGGERAALVDTGLGIGDMAVEVHTLTSLPIMVINTHSHFDHL